MQLDFFSFKETSMRSLGFIVSIPQKSSNVGGGGGGGGGGKGENGVENKFDVEIVIEPNGVSSTFGAFCTVVGTTVDEAICLRESLKWL
jgi:hypothetical protein